MKSIKPGFFKKAVGLFCVLAVFSGLIYLHPDLITPLSVKAEQPAPTSTSAPESDPASTSMPVSESIPATTRIYGQTQYDTALEISKNGWHQASTAVLATGVNFPDALTGTVLAHKVQGPLLLTEPGRLNPGVAAELRRLGVRDVYLLGGTAALSTAVEQALNDQGIAAQRLSGWNQYGTAAAIAAASAPISREAFLVNGDRFPDALSISSYAAAQGIPILLTRSNSLPQETADIIARLNIREVTFIGGSAVLNDSLIEELAGLPQPVTVKARLAGNDRYETNTIVLNQFPFSTSTIYAATGENFPDALAGAALAARNNAPILLLPPSQLGVSTTAYLNDKRAGGSSFTIFGGWGAVSNEMENILRTGSFKPRISLQYAHGGFTGSRSILSQIQSIPSPATDYADIVAPHWFYLDDAADGSITGEWDSNHIEYLRVVGAAHARNLKVLPTLYSSWDTPATADTVLASPEARAKLIAQIKDRIGRTNADGIVIDIEYMSNSTAPHLTQFMREVYAELNPMNKLVIQAVMPRTGAETWSLAFDYAALAQTADYLHIMTYDYNLSTPGPIAPLDWTKRVLDYTRGQGVDMSKVLLGMPYYGRDWTATVTETESETESAPAYSRQSRGLYGHSGFTDPRDRGMMETLAHYGGVLQRDSSMVPYFTYTDEAGLLHTAYFDDAQSWNRKLELMNEYGLGGVGAWSLFWTMSPATANELYPVLKRHLR